MKISLKNFKNTMSRAEMRTIEGGRRPCQDDCEVGNDKCASVSYPNSYCAIKHCGPSNIRIHSCQYQA